MAAVLFIVTIPTEAEEVRLKTEYIAKKLDLHTENLDAIFTPRPNEKARQSTAANTPNCTPVHSMSNNNVSSSTIDIPCTPITKTNNNINNKAGLQYGTSLPRRKTSESLTMDYMQGGAQNQTDIVGNSCSLRDLNRNQIQTEMAPPIARKCYEGVHFKDVLSAAKQKCSKRRGSMYLDLDIPDDTCMETVLREILKKFNIVHAVWTKDAEERMHQIVFTMEFNEICENILDKFQEWGIGDRVRSTVSVMNCIATKTLLKEDEFNTLNRDKTENIYEQKQGVWNRFMNSVRSRLNVAQIVRDVRQDAAITFDFLVLLVSAAVLAAFGLIEDSTIFLASSMLISPLMGPIIAAIFGTVIKDSSLRSLGLMNELIGILVATLVGFVFGLIACSIDERYGVGEGLTTEMLSRCELHSLLVGVFTAIPSGAAAAIGILGGNIGSLVGVAISASLLPPAVNSGLLWALACVSKFFETDELRYTNVLKTVSYSKDQATELAILGLISMCLTISNVVCVYLMGILVLKVKEIAPVIARNNMDFWKHDIKIARDLNKMGHSKDTAIIDEFTNLPTEDQKTLGLDCDILRNMHLERDVYQNTWSPLGNRHHYDPLYDSTRGNYLTVHRFERLYSTVTRQCPLKQRFSMSRQNPEDSTGTDTEYKKLPRCFTMPPKVVLKDFSIPNTSSTACFTNSQPIIEDATTPLIVGDRRTFIVTPVTEPSCYLPNEDEIDV